MFAQNTHWSSGEFSGTPSSVTLMRESPAPRMRIYTGPVPSPFSLHANTPGVCEKRNGSSRPVFENACNSSFLMFATAKGAFFCALTPCTTTSCNSSTDVESCLEIVSVAIATVEIAAKAIVIKTFLFIVFTPYYVLQSIIRGRESLFPTQALP